MTAPAVAAAFRDDPHAAKYRDVVQDHPEAMARVFAILDDPAHREQLVAAETYGRPALSGVVRAIEVDEVVAPVLASGDSLRFRQAVGVAVRLTMEAMGWATTGRKGPVRGSSYFRTSERYASPAPGSSGPAAAIRARAALRAVEGIGDEAERAQTATELVAALSDSRRAEGRPF